VEDGALPPLIDLLRSPDSKLQELAAGAIRNISVNANNKILIVQVTSPSPSTLGPSTLQPSTLNPQPSTLNPQPGLRLRAPLPQLLYSEPHNLLKPHNLYRRGRCRR